MIHGHEGGTNCGIVAGDEEEMKVGCDGDMRMLSGEATHLIRKSLVGTSPIRERRAPKVPLPYAIALLSEEVTG
jgi:hypothetical protein